MTSFRRESLDACPWRATGFPPAGSARGMGGHAFRPSSLSKLPASAFRKGGRQRSEGGPERVVSRGTQKKVGANGQPILLHGRPLHRGKSTFLSETGKWRSGSDGPVGVRGKKRAGVACLRNLLYPTPHLFASRGDRSHLKRGNKNAPVPQKKKCLPRIGCLEETMGTMSQETLSESPGRQGKVERRVLGGIRLPRLHPGGKTGTLRTTTPDSISKNGCTPAFPKEDNKIPSILG